MISRSQLFCLLLLSKLVGEIVFPQSTEYTLMGLGAVAAAEVIKFLLALPVLLYSIGGRDFFGSFKRKCKPLGVISVWLTAVLLTASAVRTALFTADYGSQIVSSATTAILVLCVIFTAFSAAKGIESIARAGVLFLVAGGAVVLIAGISAGGNMTTLADKFLDGMAVSGDWDRFIETVITRVLNGGEYLLFAAVLPYVRAKENSLGCGGIGFIYAGAAVTVSVGLSLFSAAVLGELLPAAAHPFTTAAQLSDITLLKRLDGLTSALWTLCGAARSAAMIAAVITLIRPQKRKAIQ